MIEPHAISTNTLASMQELWPSAGMIMNPPETPESHGGNPFGSFASVLQKVSEENQSHLVSGGTAFGESDFQGMRLELADKIKAALSHGNADGTLAALQQEYDRINSEARRVAAQAFDSALARLYTPEDNIASRIKLGRFAKDAHASPVTAAKAPGCSVLPSAGDTNALCDIPGIKVVRPPMVDVDVATPERELPENSKR